MLLGSASIFIQEFVWPETPWSCPPMASSVLSVPSEKRNGGGGAGSGSGDDTSCQVSPPVRSRAEEAAWTAKASESSNTLRLTNEFHFTAQLP